jgi:SAM-dependent methyltransferase
VTIKALLPLTLKRWLKRVRDLGMTGNHVRWGDMRRIEPFSRHFGYDRGQPIDRWYIERFLTVCEDDVHGRVLEVKDSTYTSRYGGGRVSDAEVLDIDPRNARATIIADLNSDPLPVAAFDCIILTQVLQLIYDVYAALRTLHSALKPGGTLLLTVPGITPIGTGALADTWYWSFTAASMRRLLSDACPGALIEVESLGNALAAMAFIQGLAANDLSPRELEVVDGPYPMIITGRVVKAA